jgi:hypothetical protein
MSGKRPSVIEDPLPAPTKDSDAPPGSGGDRLQNPESLEPHPIALLFLGLNEEELELLARDIAENGQRYPIVLHEGKILVGDARTGTRQGEWVYRMRSV